MPSSPPQNGAAPRRGHALVLCLLLLAGCAPRLWTHAASDSHPSQVTAFSSAVAGAAFPGGWRTFGFAGYRKATVYSLVEDGGDTVIKGRAEASSSALVEQLDVDPASTGGIEWRWKVPATIPGADTTERTHEDAPARLILSFVGDRSLLPFDVKLFFAGVKALTGIEPPYATLEYVWGAGADRVGQWVGERRDLVADYRRAFGEDPGHLTAVGVGVDTDATGAVAEGYFGDI